MIYANRVRAWADYAAIVATIIVIVSGSLYGAIRFSIATGGFNWFQQAWDEPFYISDIINSPVEFSSRSASRLLGQALLALGIRDIAWISLAYDLVFPVAVLGAAYLLSKYFANSVIARLAWALALLFSFELLAFSSYLVFASPPVMVLANSVGVPWFFAPDYLPYFNLYRTPEPQVSWAVFFTYLYLLIRYCDRRELRIYLAICCINPVLCLVYSSVAVVSLTLFVMVSIGCIWIFRRPITPWFVASVAATALTFWFTSRIGTTNLQVALTVFPTRLPILRLSILYSLLALALLAVQLRRRCWALAPRDLLCACLLVIPLITLNQHLVSGRAVIAQQWEYYINYICIVAGGGLLFTRPPDERTSGQAWLRGAPALGCWMIFLAMIARGHLENVRLFSMANAASQAQAQAYATAVSKVGPIDRVVTSDLFDDSLFMSRVPASVRVLGSYDWLVWNSPPAMRPDEPISAHLARSPASVAAGYEVLARRGVSPDGLQAELHQEIANGVCWPALIYFFAYLDCWSRLSNYRPSVNLSAAVEPIVAGYRAYRAQIANSPPSEPTLLMTSRLLGADDADGPFRHTLVGQATVEFAGHSVTAHCYLQIAP